MTHARGCMECARPRHQEGPTLVLNDQGWCATRGPGLRRRDGDGAGLLTKWLWAAGEDLGQVRRGLCFELRQMEGAAVVSWKEKGHHEWFAGEAEMGGCSGEERW